ncbi:DUF362 domain-containing protein, partial [candidate division KSB1 bacterium]
AYVPTCVSEAKYLINMGQLKGHNLAGITLNAKNLFGAIMSYPPNNIAQSSAPKNAGLHPYVCVHADFHFGGHWDFDKRDMDTYNALVDLMGYEPLGAKTMLFFIDGLYSAPDQSTELKKEHKWKSFADDWPNSIFMSQDLVAIESVCLDFLRHEPGHEWVRGNVDNYLHEAALANDAPSGTVYDPEQDGTPLSSLGVHEHWNNAVDRKYSRNLGTGDGIELIIAGSQTTVQDESERSPKLTAIRNYPNPFNPSTTITYTVPHRCQVSLHIYNLTGERVALLVHTLQDAGTFYIEWDGRTTSGPAPSGFYFAHLVAAGDHVIHQMMLLR